MKCAVKTFFLLFCVLCSKSYADVLEPAAPEQAGMSSEKLEKVKAAVQELVDKEKTAGAGVIVARAGKVVFFETFGMMDREKKKPMQKDTICRFYSMSKPVTSVAAMMLFEEGKIKLDAPVATYLPSFKNLKVYDASGEHKEQKRKMTVRDLLRHTSGLTYGFFGNTPVDLMYREAGVLDRASSLEKMAEKLGRIPLLFQPGTRWHYSVSVDVLGAVVEKVSGKPLDQFFQEKIFAPLGMKDTGFHVPEEKVSRFAACYSPKLGGGLRLSEPPGRSRFTGKPGLFSGGGGLVSTAGDYLRFCRMLVNKGGLDGTRLLRPETVEMMTKDQLPPSVKRTSDEGFGLGFSVRIKEGRFPKGEYGWGGAASTHFWISPSDRLVVIALSQLQPFSSQLEQAVKPLVYDAIEAPVSSDLYRVSVLVDKLPGHDQLLQKKIFATLKETGLKVTAITADQLTDPEKMSVKSFDLLVLPAAFSLPADSVQTVQEFLKKGGDLVTLQAPAFSDLLWKSDAEWLSRDAWRKVLQNQETKQMLLDFDDADPKQFRRSTNTPRSPAAWNLVPGRWGKALFVRIANMQGWDTLAIPVKKHPFPAGHRLTCLYARGSKETRTLSLEWRETDGSRWIAAFPVTEKWRRVVLAPEDFHFWESTPGRGGRGDRFHPEKASDLTIGVAWTHTGPRGGRYEYAIDQVGTAPDPVKVPPPVVRASPPQIEGIAPGFKFYKLRDVEKLQTKAPWFSADVKLPRADLLRAHHPRPTGKGIGKERRRRWIPLIEALGPRGRWRGAPASLFVDFDRAMPGSVRAVFSVHDASWYKEASVQKVIRETVERMAYGVFLEEAGTGRFTVWPGEPVSIGARVVNLSKRPAEGMKLRFQVHGEGAPASVLDAEQILTVSANGDKTIVRELSLPEGRNEFRVQVDLFKGGTLLDRVTHELHVLTVKPEKERRYVTVRDGDFWRDGSRRFVHGVNYMPSAGIALDNQEDFEFWIDARPYDPEFIQRDLERCRSLGLNSVSIFIYHRSLEAGNLLDILRRCEELDLMVNLSIRPGTPMSYNWPWWKEIITKHKLALFDIIYAYDIAWEPFFGTIGERRRYDANWREWIEKKYGSITKAEKVWSVTAPRFGGHVSSPVEKQLGGDGTHRKMVADYRRFVDELVHSRYQEAAERIRNVDPNHLVSFRMTVTGDPTFYGAKKMPYDFRGVARSMDFLAPEGYGRIGDWERVKPGIFTVAYARYCAPEKPVIWAEAGVHAWNVQTMQIDPDRLKFQGEYYADFCRMVLESHANGVVWWWYPGGYRTNERSDYGIINPDGTDRPATKVIRRFSPKFQGRGRRPKPDVWIDIDRDADARGLFGVYERVKEKFWRAVDAGNTPGLR